MLKSKLIPHDSVTKHPIGLHSIRLYTIEKDLNQFGF